MTPYGAMVNICSDKKLLPGQYQAITRYNADNALAMEILQSCTNPLNFTHYHKDTPTRAKFTFGDCFDVLHYTHGPCSTPNINLIETEWRIYTSVN